MILIKILLNITVIFGMPILTHHLADDFIPCDEEINFGYIMGASATLLILIFNLFLK